MSDERRYSGDRGETELRRLRLLDYTIYNLLGLRDPEKVAAWINGARQELRASREKIGLGPEPS